jgi:hypothetical protein
MRFLISALALVALLAPQAASARPGGHAAKLAQRDSLIHGIAGDEEHVFVTEPGIGVSAGGPRVVVLDRKSGRQEAVLPAPPGGFKLPFTLRVPETGHLVVLDSGGFPPQGPPTVYDYRYSVRGAFKASLTRTVDFTGLPLGFAEDVEVLPNGEYVVSESVFGGLWLIGRDGKVRPGIVPDPPTAPLKNLGPCEFPDGGTGMVGGVPFQAGGNFAPGAGSLAVRGDWLYLSSTCRGGVQKVRISTLRDGSRPAVERDAQIVEVAHRRYPLESLKGIQFNRWDRDDKWIYAGDPFRLQLIRIDSRTGRREVLSRNDRLFDFTVSTAFLPPARRGKDNPLVTASDQEYRWATLNVALTGDLFRPPFTVAEFWPRWS